MRITIYDITKRLTNLSVNAAKLAENIRQGKRAPLADMDQELILRSLGSIVDSEVTKVCQYVVGLETTIDSLNKELEKYEQKVINLEKEIDTLSIEGYLWK